MVRVRLVEVQAVVRALHHDDRVFPTWATVLISAVAEPPTAEISAAAVAVIRRYFPTCFRTFMRLFFDCW
jgi:hypothetical protein